MVRNKKLQELELALHSLVIFRKLLTHEVILPLRQMLDTETTDPMIQLKQYAEFVARLYPRSTNLTEYILKLVLEDDNFYIRMLARGEKPAEMLELCARNELLILQRLARLRPAELQKEISYYGVLPEWETSEIDFGLAYSDRAREIRRYGYGKYAQFTCFTLRDGVMTPVNRPDPVLPDELTGYETERAAVTENLRALAEGRPAQHMLLTGDPGTGKSAAVKAAVNALADQGLRILQMRKEQLSELPAVLDEIAVNPLRFVVLLDDLTLSAGEPACALLRTVLEGSVALMPTNAAVCVTCSGDRLSGDLEGILAPRFGLRVQFSAPDAETYLRIVQAEAERLGVPVPTESAAEQFAATRGERSPRAAKQLTELIGAKQSDRTPQDSEEST